MAAALTARRSRNQTPRQCAEITWVGADSLQRAKKVNISSTEGPPNNSRLPACPLSGVPGHVPLLSTNNLAIRKLYEFVSRTGRDCQYCFESPASLRILCKV
jgi:hypothetical protein